MENSLGHYMAVCIGSAAASIVILWVWSLIKPRKVSDMSRAWVEIDSSALLHNAEALESFMPEGTHLMAVLKPMPTGTGPCAQRWS